MSQRQSLRYAYDKDDSSRDMYYRYDRMGQLLSMEDSEGNIVLYSYEEAGNISNVTHPDGTLITYEYDKNNNLNHVKDATGKSTKYFQEINKRMLILIPVLKIVIGYSQKTEQKVFDLENMK